MPITSIDVDLISASTGRPQQHWNNFGFYGVMDRQLWHDSDAERNVGVDPELMHGAGDVCECVQLTNLY